MSVRRQVNVRFGSEADICNAVTRVRFGQGQTFFATRDMILS
jgi:hypothetical protein